MGLGCPLAGFPRGIKMRGTNRLKTRFTKDDVVPAQESSAIGALIDKVDDLSRKSSSQQLIVASPTATRPYPASISMVVSEKVNSAAWRVAIFHVIEGKSHDR
jgi:hypothetical protein